MIKTSLLRYASVGMATVGLGLGTVAASTVGIGGTQNNTSNDVTATTDFTATATDDSTIFALNANDQNANSGDVDVDDTAAVDDVSTGDADVDNTSHTSVTKSSAGMGSFWNAGGSGSDSVTVNGTMNNVDNTVDVSRTTTLTWTDNSTTAVINFNDQDANSGDVDIDDTASVGNVSTGDASASNNTTTTISH
jgi:hypothetical protein